MMIFNEDNIASFLVVSYPLPISIWKIECNIQRTIQKKKKKQTNKEIKQTNQKKPDLNNKFME